MLSRSNGSYAVARPSRARSCRAQAPSIYTSPWSSSRGVTALPYASRRFYRAGDDGRKSGTILVRNGTAIGQEDLISAITPVRLWSNPLNNERDVVLLVSKGLSHWLNAGDNFLPEVLRKLLRNHIDSNISQINVLLAVVDRIPAPSNTSADGRTSMTVSSIHGLGSEGLAYRVSDGQQLLQPDDMTATPAHNSIRDRNRPFEGPPGAIQFRFLDQKQEGAPTSLEVALANTIFSTATRRLLRRSTWALPLRQSHARDLESAVVNLPSDRFSKLTVTSSNSMSSADMEDVALALNIPLLPLTPRRTISDCMGNVIRGIKDAKDGASKELEDAVTQYFEDNGENPMTAAVWAVIIPQELLDDLAPSMKRMKLGGQESDKAIFEQPPVLELWRGATLRKVISGGGGWGDKAGILSLDHDTGVSPTSSRSNNNNMELDLDAPDFANLFSQKRLVDDIAKAGDSIQFFIAPENRHVPVPSSMGDHAETPARLTSLDFGVIPIATEAVEIDVPTSINGEGEKMTAVYPGHFGALSEVGLGLRRQISGLHKTKIDVPFSRFWYQQVEHVRRKIGEQHDGSESPNRSQNSFKQKTVRSTKARRHKKPSTSTSATTFASAFKGRSLNDVLGKQESKDSGTIGQSRQYSTRVAKEEEVNHRSTNHFHLPARSRQEDSRILISRGEMQTKTVTQAKTASEQATRDLPLSTEYKPGDSARASVKFQRTSPRSALDDKGASRLAKSDPSPTPAVRHVLLRERHEPQHEDPTVSAQHDERRAIPRAEQDVNLIQRNNVVAHPRKYELVVKIRKHGVREDNFWKTSASRPTPLTESESPHPVGSVRIARGMSLTKHKISKSIQKYTPEDQDPLNIANSLRQKQRHAAYLDKTDSQAGLYPTLVLEPLTLGSNNIRKSIVHPPPVNVIRTYVAPDSFTTSRDRRIETRKTLEALQGSWVDSKPGSATFQEEDHAPLRMSRTSRGSIRPRRVQSDRARSMPLRNHTVKVRRRFGVRKHIVDKSELFAPARLQAERAYHIARVRQRQAMTRLVTQPDIVPDLPRFSDFGKSDLFADYDVPVRKTVPKKMPRYSSKLLSIPELMQRRARVRRKRQSGSTRMVRTMPSAGLVRTMPSSRLVRTMPPTRHAQSRKLRRAYTIRRKKVNSLYEMAARGNAEDTQKLQEIKAWLDARMASSSTMSGEDHTFKIEDWSGPGQSTGKPTSFRPRSNRALDEIDDVFRDLYGQ